MAAEKRKGGGRMKALAVIFPGIGYTADKPLLHYGRRIAEKLGCESLILPYAGFPRGVKGDPDKMRRCYALALTQARELLAGVDLESCDPLVFIGKSIGTAVAAQLAAERGLSGRVRFLLYTPLEETFSFPLGDALVFTGSADPWVGGKESRIPALCRERDIPCVVVPDANHSLETDDPQADLEALREIMRETERWLKAE